ncbi:glutamyl aminopeptidase-like [Pogonomyrmex barbatus]|uniref:Glutamyl aminopeptidase-like n=1 Tax=Pogonomyrmex barbatus TaxID=144034 RepID=A0A8N1S447_9HYME|nr:glutamyl aminopeptidase-like [Pogonomyrmex barbatus]
MKKQHFQAVKARRAFPCWDEPAIRTTFNISINCHKNYIVISNTMAETFFVQGDMKWSVFRTTPAIPTYLVAISLMNSNYNNHIKYKIGHWYYRRDLEPEEDIYKQELDHSMKKINMARLIAREIIHHYFGNYVSPSWWSHFWLNDGIAMLLGIHVIEKRLQYYDMLLLMKCFGMLLNCIQKDMQLEDWIIVNSQQTGYYRVNYDTTNWIRIADFLQMNHTMIHVLNSAQIIDDAFHLMEAGQLSANIFWELTSYLWKETDYIA